MAEDNRVSDNSGAPARMPDFMVADAGAGTENFEVKDIAWMGDDGASEDYVDQFLEKVGFDRRSPFELLLLAINDANPISNRPTREVRLEQALAALTGDGRRKRGMDEKDDYDLLLQMGWEYHCDFWRLRHPPEIGPIARRCIECLPAKDPRRNEGMVDVISAVKRLRNKFAENKDLYIARATSQMDHRRMDKLRALAEIVERMQELGIPANPEALAPDIFHLPK